MGKVTVRTRIGMSALFLLYESAVGYALLTVKEWEQIGKDSSSVQEAVEDSSRFTSICSLKAFHPFAHAEEALENINAVATGAVTDLLNNFLENNLPKKKSKCSLGVIDTNLGKTLSDKEFPVVFDKNIVELFRGVRLHFAKLSSNLTELDLERARVGLAHSYSRNKMQLDPNRQDKPIMNASALIENMDKTNNSFAMKMREWYGWHFPELAKIVTDNDLYCRCVRVIGNRLNWSEDKKKALLAVVGSEEVVDEIMAALKISMGREMAESDLSMVDSFTSVVVDMHSTRKQVGEYMTKKLSIVAPNLQAVVGDNIAAKLITHAGSLVNLAKAPASTIQIMGAEKAHFRALKTKGNTPKYGLLFNTSAVSKAAQKNKGRISRCLANKCSIASRIDAFSTGVPNCIFGDKLKDQVDERLAFLSEGVTPRKNLDVMREAVQAHGAQVLAKAAANAVESKDKKKERKSESKSSKPEEVKSEEKREKRKSESRKEETDAVPEKKKSKKEKKD
eukprot:GDKK01062482.1.p1 GENE.GDKK01062482.1~~GDKK01062482.1.p1  ORF type:complete len:507 (+),score=180.14 GDKK01062482.1:1-1521(+)